MTALQYVKQLQKKSRKRNKNSPKYLKITIEANKKVVNFLDVTFDRRNGSYKPYMKPNNKLLYDRWKSNHPPALLRNIPWKSSSYREFEGNNRK